jgi:hypothetical protein
MLQSGQLSTLGIGHYFAATMADAPLVVDFTLERFLDGAQNHVLLRPEIARELSLERLPNPARRQFLSCADGGTDEFFDRGMESLVGHRGMGGRRRTRHVGAAGGQRVNRGQGVN